MNNHRRSPTRSWIWLSAVVAIAGGVGCALVAMQQYALLGRAYLFAFLCVWLVTIGATGLVALGNLTGGRWAAVARPLYLTASQLLPLVAILFIPIAMNLAAIYPWADESRAAELHLPADKAKYLEPTFFIGRAVGYFAVWLVIGWWLGVVSRLDRPPATTFAMRRAGAVSLVLLVPTATFAAFDWGMSLEPTWYSSIYGALLTAGGVLAAHALALLSLAARPTADVNALVAMADHARERRMEHGEPLAHLEPPENPAAEVLNDLGNLMLAFIMVWAYFAFSQFLIIWSGNLPSEIPWYIRRLSHGWQYVAIAIVLLHFAAPFMMLLSRDRKRDVGRLVRVAALLAVMYLVNLYWTIVPAFGAADWLSHAANLAALALVGGLWMLVYSWQADRRMRQALAHHSAPSR